MTAGASKVSLSISAERQLTIVNSSDKYAKNKNENARRNGVNIANKQPKRLLGLAQSRNRPLDDSSSDIVAKKASLGGSRFTPAGKALGEVSVSTRCITAPCGEERRKCLIVDIVVAPSSIRLTESFVTPAEEILPESRATEAPPKRKMKKKVEGDAFVDSFSPKRMSVVNSTQTIGVNDGYNEVVNYEDNVRIADLSKSSRIESQSAIRDNGPDRSRVNLEIDTGLRAHLGNANWFRLENSNHREHQALGHYYSSIFLIIIRRVINMAKTAAGKKKVFVKATKSTKAHYRSTPNKK